MDKKEVRKILDTYSIPELKRIIRATNITGYSKLNKNQLLDLMIRPENLERFNSMKPKSARMGTDLSKVNRQFKRQAKRPRELFELKEASKKIQEAINKKKNV